MKIIDDFCYAKEEAITCYATKSTLFTVSKWNTKEDTGKSMKMYCMYCGMPKCTSWAKVKSNNEKIESAPLAIVV